MFGPENMFAVVAIENVDMGRCWPREGGAPPGAPICDPDPPNMLKLVIMVFRGSLGIIPYALPVFWKPMGGIDGGICP